MTMTLTAPTQPHPPQETHAPVGRLWVDRTLVDFLDREALPQAGVDRAQYWAGFERVFGEFSGRHPRHPARAALRGDAAGDRVPAR